MTKLSVEPLVHETAIVSGCTLGRYTEIGERSRVSETVLGDYSYLGVDCEIWWFLQSHKILPLRLWVQLN